MSVDMVSTNLAVAFLDESDDTVICRECADGYDTSDLIPQTQDQVNEYGDLCAMCNIDLATAY